MNRVDCWIGWLALVALSTVPMSNFATGPSSADIKLVPLAAGDGGMVIFKTYVHRNGMGSHSPRGAKHGWLCASQSGVWEAAVHLELTDDPSPEVRAAVESFKRRSDLSSPPASLEALLRSCGFTGGRPLLPGTGRRRVVWYPDHFCVDSSCFDGELTHVTLEGIESRPGTGSAVTARFFYQGLAVFRNVDHYDEDLADQVGAYFYLRNEINGENAGYDIKTIDAVVRVPYPLWEGAPGDGADWTPVQ